MSRKFLITGATGLIGKHIVNELLKRNDSVKIISTDANKAVSDFDNNIIKVYQWSYYNTPEKLKEIIEDTDVIINLAGVNVAKKRWTDNFKKEIYDSRINTTKLLVDSIKLCNKKPECLINASAVGIYGFRGDEVINEESTLGNDFMAKVCIDWEKEAMKAEDFNVRVVTVRAGIVLDKNEGALEKLIQPFKFFIGGHLGSGRQWFSWIHAEDCVRIYLLAADSKNIKGALNGTSPNAVTSKQLSQSIGEVLKRPALFTVPGFALKIVLGEFAESLLTGQRVYPEKAIDAGFNFKFNYLKEALENLLIK